MYTHNTHTHRIHDCIKLTLQECCQLSLLKSPELRKQYLLHKVTSTK